MTQEIALEPVINSQQAVIFIGMMGAGKTTIGKALARELGRTFIDLDHEIVKRCGVAIPTIFDIEGEAGFRKRETATLQEVVRLPNLVLATGGGAVIEPLNQSILRDSGTVIYLKAGLDDLFRRVSKDSNRPLLQTENPRERLRLLLEQRCSLYERLADITFESGSGSVQKAVKRLKQHLSKGVCA